MPAPAPPSGLLHVPIMCGCFLKQHSAKWNATDIVHGVAMQVEGALECAKATAEVMRTVVTRRGHATPQALITELTSYGAQLQAAKPHGQLQTPLASLACRHAAQQHLPVASSRIQIPTIICWLLQSCRLATLSGACCIGCATSASRRATCPASCKTSDAVSCCRDCSVKSLRAA